MTLNRREGKQLDTPGRAWLIALALATYLAACSDGTTPVDGGATDAGAREASADTGAGGPARILPPKTGCYLGMFPGWGEYEDSISVSTLQEFRQLTGRKVAFTAFSNAWGRDYSSNKQLLAIAGHGAIPMLRIMPFGSPYWSKPFGFQDKYSLERIIKGEHDKLIAAWADVVKKFGKPVMVTFAVEMNGNWFPWSGWFQGGAKTDGYGDPKKPDGPEKFVAAWRHVWSVFNKRGVTNATWYWHPNGESYPVESWNTMERYYPGHAYVDWVAVSVYGAQTSGEDWKSFGAVMDKVYDRLQKLAPGKPLMIPEWGVGEFPTKGDKAKWYADALLALRTKYTRIKIAVLYSERWTNSDSSVSDLRVNSTPAALAAYKKGVSAAYFHDSYKASLAK